MTLTIGSMRRAFDAAMKESARLLDVPLERMFEHDRHKSVVAARNAAVWACRERGVSTPYLADRFKMHHTTLIHGTRVARDRALADPEYRAVCEAIRDSIPKLADVAKIRDRVVKTSEKSRAQLRDSRKAPEKRHKPQIRSCITCRSSFMSEGPQNRMCHPCRVGSDDCGMAYGVGRHV